MPGYYTVYKTDLYSVKKLWFGAVRNVNPLEIGFWDLNNLDLNSIQKVVFSDFPLLTIDVIILALKSL